MDDTVPIPEDDAEMNAAMAEARRRLPELRRALDEDARRLVPTMEGALVKARVASAITVWTGFTEGTGGAGAFMTSSTALVGL